MTESLPLAGCGVLVTRPEHQAQGLIDVLTASGAKVFSYPTITIVPAPPSRSLQHLAEVDYLIFISPNAVEYGKRLIGASENLPPGLEVAAVGRATAKTLRVWGVHDVIVPSVGADSEALLAAPQFQQVSDKRMIIVRGVGGRELLGETLIARGAQVAYAEVYERALPEKADDRLERWLGTGVIDVVTATSAAGLENLLVLAGPNAKEMLCRLPLVVVSGRMLQLAEMLGFEGPIRVAEGAGDTAVTDAVVALWQGRSIDE